MFDLQEDKKLESTLWLWIGASAVVVVLAAGALLYMMSRGDAEAPALGSSPAQSSVVGDADPLRDLKLIRASMSKDSTGMVAVWLVHLRNRSTVYAYRDIQYETTYIGVDGRPLVANTGTIEGSIEPGGEKYVSELRDVLYPDGTAEYRFRLTGATATAK